MENEPEQVGYGRPPTATRFQKGQSGNPRGRPRKASGSDIPYDSLLGQMVTIREDGRQRRVTAAEAFLLHLTKKGLSGDSAAARASLAAIENARSRRGAEELQQIKIIWKGVSPGSVGCSIEPLGIATKLNRYSEVNARILLKPWIVQLALDRMQGGELSADDQMAVMKVTQKPEKVEWPSWWSMRAQCHQLSR
ncbi:hypothetical protein GCM10022281_05070 [Sphingomonas rosea]|uniref:DUF5681 domain-containing protein n=1 Tax=Sphingomonas rosea TaxID=335605 RepID=A0ABP7TQG2_9SPHN